MNTGQYYFDKLPKDVQEKFKANYIAEEGIKEFRLYLKDKKVSHNSFVASAFFWHNTPEGCDYWEKISETIYP